MSEFSRLKERASNLFHERRTAFEVGPVNLEIKVVYESPVVDAQCFGEAFPHESPPRVELEILPDVSEEELLETIADELTHIKHPDLAQYDSNRQEREEFREKMKECLSA